MAVAIAFDTLRYTKRLEGANIPRGQAEAQASALAEVFDAHLQELATKDDVKAVKDDVKALLENMATKDDVKALWENMSTKDDVKVVKDDVKALWENMSTKDDVKAVKDDVRALWENMSTKDDVKAVKDDVKTLRGDFVRLDKQLVVIKWMLAIIITATVLPALKTLLKL